ncbi:peptidylprolyl isomerase [Anaplasma bovis]|uniref:peptidylprolyl isomerase n=1 Tax=Anaplasma bovis TaxID=186733 RepID=UPI002FEEDCE5
MRSKKIFVGVVISVVTCAFFFTAFSGLSPIGSFSTNSKGNDRCLAKVRTRCFSLHEYRTPYQNEILYIERAIGAKLTDAQIEQFGIKNSVLKSILGELLIEEFARDVGLKVNPKSIRDLIRGIDTFHNASGDFDKDKFQSALEDLGTTESAYVKKIQDSLPSIMLSECIFPKPSEMKLKYHDLLAKDVFMGLSQYRVADIVEISPAAARDYLTAEPSESELQDMYKKEGGEGMVSPEYRSIKYIAVDEEDSLSQSTVSEEEIEYEIKNSKLHDQRDVLNLVFSDKNEALSAHSAIKEGSATFESFVKNSTIEDITLNNVTRDILPVDVRSNVFELSEGGITEVFRSMVGWHIMKVLRKHEISKEDLVELKEKVSLRIRKQKAREVFLLNLRKANELISKGASFSDVKSVFISPSEGEVLDFDIRGMTSEGVHPNVKHTINIEAISTLAFSSQLNSLSHFVDLGDTHFSIMVTNVSPPRAITFEESRPMLLRKWKEDTRSSEMYKIAAGITGKLRLGEDIGDLVGVYIKKGEELYDSSSLSGRRSAPKYPGFFVDTVFNMKVGDVSNAIMDHSEDGDRIYIAVLRDVKDPAIDEEGLAKFKEGFSSDAIFSLREQLLAYLTEKYDVKVNLDLLDKV